MSVLVSSLLERISSLPAVLSSVMNDPAQRGLMTNLLKAVTMTVLARRNVTATSAPPQVQILSQEQVRVGDRVYSGHFLRNTLLTLVLAAATAAGYQGYQHRETVRDVIREMSTKSVLDALGGVARGLVNWARGHKDSLAQAIRAELREKEIEALKPNEKRPRPPTAQSLKRHVARHPRPSPVVKVPGGQ